MESTKTYSKLTTVAGSNTSSATTALSMLNKESYKQTMERFTLS